MAAEHVRALVAAGVAPDRVVVAARRPAQADELARRLGVGSASLDNAAAPVAVVAVGEEALAETAERLIERGARTVLVEKPGGLHARALDGLRRTAASVFVGYNRRFYASVGRARELIEADGGPVCLTFEFTEVERLVLADRERRALGSTVLQRWGIANSLHVIDLAFHLGGAPERLATERSGSLEWHPAGALFAGCGVTARGALFAYSAAWSGAGRWSVEVTTSARKLVLRPLETLSEQVRGSFDLSPLDLADEPAGVKPGLAAQAAAVRAVAAGGAPDPRLCTLDEAAERIALAERIFGYG
jgi:predicted dehydrogenase